MEQIGLKIEVELYKNGLYKDAQKQELIDWLRNTLEESGPWVNKVISIEIESQLNFGSQQPPKRQRPEWLQEILDRQEQETK